MMCMLITLTLMLWLLTAVDKNLNLQNCDIHQSITFHQFELMLMKKSLQRDMFARNNAATMDKY